MQQPRIKMAICESSPTYSYHSCAQLAPLHCFHGSVYAWRRPVLCRCCQPTLPELLHVTHCALCPVPLHLPPSVIVLLSATLLSTRETGRCEVA